MLVMLRDISLVECKRQKNLRILLNFLDRFRVIFLRTPVLACIIFPLIVRQLGFRGTLLMSGCLHKSF